MYQNVLTMHVQCHYFRYDLNSPYDYVFSRSHSDILLCCLRFNYVSVGNFRANN